MFPDPILYGTVDGSHNEITRSGSRRSGMTTTIRTDKIGPVDIKCVTIATYDKRRNLIDFVVVVSEIKTGKVLKTLSYQSNENDV